MYISQSFWNEKQETSLIKICLVHMSADENAYSTTHLSSFQVKKIFFNHKHRLHR